MSSSIASNKIPLFLSGFMGSGKSTVGRKLASALQVDFCDLDAYIENIEQCSIAKIFQTKGEQYFRQAEAKYLPIAATEKSGVIIATGGGTLLNAHTAKIARELGRVIFLDAPFSTCYRRITQDESRPLVKNNSQAQLKDIYNQRHPIYLSHADFCVLADRPVKQIVADCLAFFDI